MLQAKIQNNNKEIQHWRNNVTLHEWAKERLPRTGDGVWSLDRHSLLQLRLAVHQGEVTNTYRSFHRERLYNNDVTQKKFKSNMLKAITVALKKVEKGQVIQYVAEWQKSS